MMRESLLWRLHHHRYDPREPPLTLFEEAYTTKHRMVRIFKVRRAAGERGVQGVACGQGHRVLQGGVLPRGTQARARAEAQLQAVRAEGVVTCETVPG
eukprot:scaffold55160_cov91-Phaeocystis_antarctica.AAC.1